jgi:large subunit ribosomal protein L23
VRLEDAQKILKRPYVTERTFDQIERENKLCFLVDDRVSKTQIADADVNTSRTIRGKKAFVRLSEDGKAAELATKLGLV